MSKSKVVKEVKSLNYSEANQIKWELEQLDLSYVPKGFNVREVRLIVQENIIGLSDVLRAIEPQQKEVNALVADYNVEVSELQRKFNINVKDYVLSKEEKIEFEEKLGEIREKHKSSLEDFKVKNKELTKFMDDQECSFVLKKNIKKEMLPSNITGSDTAILSRLIEW